MRTARGMVALALAALASASSLSAQVEARQATPADVARADGKAAPPTEVPNPMLLTVSLAGVENLVSGASWIRKETAAFVCDQAAVEQVKIERPRSSSRKKVVLKFTPMLTSGWYRQDVDVTMEVLGPDGASLAKRLWDDLTLGNDKGPYAGTTRWVDLTLELPTERFDQLFHGAPAPSLKILLEVQNEERDGEKGNAR